MIARTRLHGIVLALAVIVLSFANIGSAIGIRLILYCLGGLLALIAAVMSKNVVVRVMIGFFLLGVTIFAYLSLSLALKQGASGS